MPTASTVIGCLPVLLLLLLAVSANEPCSDENCKVDSTSRLTWTLLGVLMLINLLLFLMLLCTWYYLFTRIRDLRNQIRVSGSSRNGKVIDSHVSVNDYCERSLPSQSEDPPEKTHDQAPSIAISKSADTIPPSIRTSIDRSNRDSDDYSTVADAVWPPPPSPQLDGVVQHINRSASPLKHSKSGSESSAVHPFSKAGRATVSKIATHQHKHTQSCIGAITQAAPTPLSQSPRSKSENEAHYSHIIDGLSPTDDNDSLVFVTSTSPPIAVARNSALFLRDANSDPTTMQSKDDDTSKVYSTPIADGVKNYRRMTAGKRKSKAEDDTREVYLRPKSALDLYPLDDIASSRSSSQSSTRKSRPASAYSNDPL